MPRFALLHHDHPIIHWDFLLEDNDRLLAWRLETRPIPGERINALRLPDHRLIYLDYEGPVSQDRGSVFREDRGEFQRLDGASGEFQLRTRGEWLTGTISLIESAEETMFVWSL